MPKFEFHSLNRGLLNRDLSVQYFEIRMKEGAEQTWEKVSFFYLLHHHSRFFANRMEVRLFDS